MASEIIQLHSEQEEYEVGSLMEILEDEDNNIDLEDILAGTLDNKFYQYNGNVPNYGYTSSTFWVRMTFENRTANEEWMLEIAYPPHDSLELYTKSGDGDFHYSKTGDQLPFSEREVHHRNFIYNLSIAPGSRETYYLKVESDGSMQLPVTLWPPDQFNQKSQLEYILLGIYYGFGLIMIFYHLFLFFSLRLSSYFWYVLFIASLMFLHFTLNGLAYQFFWTEQPWWNHHAILFFIVMTNMPALFFTKSFLNTAFYIPKLNKIINGVIILQPVFIIMLFISYELSLDIIMVATIGIILLIIIPTAILSWRRGYAPTKYFFFGWITFLLGTVVSSLADMGILPINFVTKYASQLGSAVEIALFSLALGGKIRQLRLEKQAAEETALKSQELAVSHLRKANELKDEFLANTSHELRTPLHGMIGLAESIREKDGLNEEMQHNISLIISSGRRLTHLIEDLLDASKLNHHEVNLEVVRVDLKKLADMVCTVSESMNNNKSITIRNDITEDMPPVAGDKNRLQQIFYNLIGNAIKYTESGEIILTAEPAKDEVVVSIKDTGIGISEEDVERIFDSFTRGSNIDDKSVHGTGLGLRITEQLVDLHGGKIEIASNVGEGTVVSFTVPIFQERHRGDVITFPGAGAYAPYEHLRMEVPAKEKDGPSLGKILIADDEPVNIQVLMNHLSTVGYVLKVAIDGEEVLHYLENDRSYDLVILDVMLPKLSGLDAAKKIREQFSLTELPILMLTARSQMEDIITAFEAGANDYLTKPTSKEELLARTKTLLSLKLTMEEVVKVNKELKYLNQSLESQVAERTEELELRTDELRIMEKSRRQLMSNISHELGTPMTSVRGYVKAMLDGVVDGNDENYLTIVYQKILVIDRLIQDLYDLSRLEARRVSFRRQEVTTEELQHMLISKYEMDVKYHGIDFRIYNDLGQESSQESVIIDPDRLDQVMQNLIFNAIRFTDANGTIEVHIRKLKGGKKYNLPAALAKKAPLLHVSVRDNGEGISDEAIDYIFDRFFREEKSRIEKDTHSGLGLAISKEIIEAHQGHIWAESKSGEGSIFHFVLPLESK
ncbi:ATP-binding protein [Virgibacillus oceani]